MEQAVSRLKRAFADAGLSPMEPPDSGNEATIADAVRAVAPFRIPSEVIEFWSLVKPESLAVQPFHDAYLDEQDWRSRAEEKLATDGPASL
jgi:hypothetical protein